MILDNIPEKKSMCYICIYHLFYQRTPEKKKNIWRADLIKAIMENIQDVLRAEAKVQISFAQ